MSVLLLVLEIVVSSAVGVGILFALVYGAGLLLQRHEADWSRRHEEARRLAPVGHPLWPTFPSPESGRYHCRAASFVPFLLAAGYALCGAFHRFGYGEWVWVLSAGFVAAGVGMRNGSRVAAVYALAAYLALQAVPLSRGELPMIDLLLPFVVVLVFGVRAAFAAHRPSDRAPAGAPA